MSLDLSTKVIIDKNVYDKILMNNNNLNKRIYVYRGQWNIFNSIFKKQNKIIFENKKQIDKIIFEYEEYIDELFIDLSMNPKFTEKNLQELKKFRIKKI